MPTSASTTPAPLSKSTTKTTCIAAALTQPSLPPLPDRPPAPTTVYTLVLPSTGWAVFLRHGRSRVLPLFTGPNEVRVFLAGARLPECRAVKLPTAGAVADFLRSPPGRFGGASDFLVAVDPTDLTNLTPVLLTAREAIAALAGDYQ